MVVQTCAQLKRAPRACRAFDGHHRKVGAAGTEALQRGQPLLDDCLRRAVNLPMPSFRSQCFGGGAVRDAHGDRTLVCAELVRRAVSKAEATRQWCHRTQISGHGSIPARSERNLTRNPSGLPSHDECYPAPSDRPQTRASVTQHSAFAGHIAMQSAPNLDPCWAAK